MKAILSGTTSINLFLEFLHRNNHTDKLVLKNIKVHSSHSSAAAVQRAVVWNSNSI